MNMVKIDERKYGTCYYTDIHLLIKFGKLVKVNNSIRRAYIDRNT